MVHDSLMVLQFGQLLCLCQILLDVSAVFLHCSSVFVVIFRCHLVPCAIVSWINLSVIWGWFLCHPGNVFQINTNLWLFSNFLLAVFVWFLRRIGGYIFNLIVLRSFCLVGILLTLKSVLAFLFVMFSSVWIPGFWHISIWSI